MDIDRAARRYALWTVVMLPISLAALIDATVATCLIVARGTYPPVVVTRLLLLAAAGVPLGLIYSALWARSLRRHHAEWVSGQGLGSPPIWRLYWTLWIPFILLMPLLNAVAPEYLGLSRSRDLRILAPLAVVAGFFWAMPLMYREAAAIRRDVLARKAEATETNEAA